MNLNLIEAKWLPIQRRDGTCEKIAPWEITTQIDENPVVSLVAPKPYFNGALIQFLIGLFQTTLTPKNERAWRRTNKNGMKPDSIHNALLTVKDFFNLDGEGIRFMQDFSHLRDVKEFNEIDTLLLETPGMKTKKNNSDHFIKRQLDFTLCDECTAMALFTLQINASGGGRGYRTSIRGGGPLTTIVLGDTLWNTIWNNILSETNLEELGCNLELNNWENIFPWSAPTKTSEKGQKTQPAQVHPFHLFWSMPNRIVLGPIRNEKRICSLCGKEKNFFYDNFKAKTYGYNYDGPWKHPLTPTALLKDDIPNPRKMQRGGIVYHHWLGIVQNSVEKNSKHLPAEVIKMFRTIPRFPRDFRIWTFGFDMDNAKARGWYSSIMPVPNVSDENRQDFEVIVEQLILAAKQTLSNLIRALKTALFDAKKKVTFNSGNVNSQFWHDTDKDFFKILNSLRNLFDDDLSDSSYIDELKLKWLYLIFNKANRIFTDYVEMIDFSAAAHKRIALAHNKLRRYNSKRSKFFINLLDLPNEKNKEVK